MRYRLQRHDGTDCSATMVPITVLRMVPIQRYRQYIFIVIFCLVGFFSYDFLFYSLSHLYKMKYICIYFLDNTVFLFIL